MGASAFGRKLCGYHGSAPGKPVTYSRQEQDCDQRAVEQRGAHVGFYLPVVMNHSGNGRKIDGAVQYPPASPAEAANPACRRSNGQWNQEQETEKAYGDEWALGDDIPHGTKLERLLVATIHEEVQAEIE